MPSIVDNDSDLRFPSNIVVTASAGSGKTYTLTWRYLQLLLSAKNPHRLLRNLLAITFTNNAAKEMRERVLNYLKQLCLGNEEVLRQAARFLDADARTLREESRALIDHLFANYSEFQIRTIDSFMATVFRASALEFGFHSDFEILMTNDTLIEQAFELFVRDLNEEDARLFESLASLIGESRAGSTKYLWDPYAAIIREVKRIYRLLSSQTRNEVHEDLSSESQATIRHLITQGDALSTLIDKSGLRINQTLASDLELIRSSDVNRVITHTLKTKAVNKAKSKKEEDAFQRWGGEIEAQLDALNELLKQYIVINARSYYHPYLQAIAMVRETLASMKRQRGQIFIEDVNKMLVGRLNDEVVPEIYFGLGDVIYHYLIDEFQDTSPIQWANLRPLIENSLSVGGSLFIVGDMKQSIYGFRGADWTIMKHMTLGNEFPSARYEPRKLSTNWRSSERIVGLVKEVFETIVPTTEYAGAAQESGLTAVYQNVREENRGKGYVEVNVISGDEREAKEREHVLNIIRDCCARGYRQGDIAILTPTNSKVIEVSGWLNKEGIEFLSYSSLDARTRKLIGELIALLRFLDSPIDDLSFATFAAGGLFGKVLAAEGVPPIGDSIHDLIMEANAASGAKPPLYKGFQGKYPVLWSRYFEDLYNQVGYLPLYDLVSTIYATFKVFEAAPQEEAAYSKLLDVVQAFEQEGNNSIKDFLEFATDEAEQASWEIDAPGDKDAVSLMTIHKAKGLERPVVIVLLEESRPDSRTYYIDQDAAGIRVLRIAKDSASKVEALRQIYEEERLKERVDELNRLYVALTRAKEELYVLAVGGDEAGPPVMFFPRSGYEAGPKPSVPARKRPAQKIFGIYHYEKRRELKTPEYEPLGLEEIRRGEFIHQVLAEIEFADKSLDATLDSAMRRAQDQLRYNLPIPDIGLAVRNFLAKPDVVEYFSRVPGRRVLREQEFSTREGSLFRADRIVIDKNDVVVLDFKTGGDEREEEYRRQLRNYMDIVREIFPSLRVGGLIAYVDAKILRRVQ